MTRPLRTHLSVLQSLVPLAGLAVDIGAGDGGFAARLQATVPGLRAVAVDPQGALLCAGLAAGVAGVAALGEALPIAGGVADLALFTNSLHHVPVGAQAAALDEAVRVTRPCGHIVVREPLAEGALFELLRPIDDETAVRAAAMDQVDALAGRGPVRLVAQQDYDAPTIYRDFAALRAHVVAVDPGRAAAVAAMGPGLEAGYRAIADPTPDGDRLITPSRIWVFERVAGVPADRA